MQPTQAQMMVIKTIYCINVNDCLIDPDNPGQTISTLSIKLCNLLQCISNMSLTYWQNKVFIAYIIAQR